MLLHTEYSKQCLAEDRVQQLSAMAMALAELSHVTEEQTEAQRATVLWSRPQSLQGERTPVLTSNSANTTKTKTTEETDLPIVVTWIDSH